SKELIRRETVAWFIPRELAAAVNRPKRATVRKVISDGKFVCSSSQSMLESVLDHHQIRPGCCKTTEDKLCQFCINGDNPTAPDFSCVQGFIGRICLIETEPIGN